MNLNFENMEYVTVNKIRKRSLDTVFCNAVYIMFLRDRSTLSFMFRQNKLVILYSGSYCCNESKDVKLSDIRNMRRL